MLQSNEFVVTVWHVCKASLSSKQKIYLYYVWACIQAKNEEVKIFWPIENKNFDQNVCRRLESALSYKKRKVLLFPSFTFRAGGDVRDIYIGPFDLNVRDFKLILKI